MRRRNASKVNRPKGAASGITSGASAILKRTAIGRAEISDVIAGFSPAEARKRRLAASAADSSRR